MRTLFTSTFVAVAAAALTGTVVSAQNRGLVPVNIHPAASVPVVLFEGADAGRTLVTTGRDGKGSFNVAEIANLSKLDVVEEKCASATRVLLVAEGVDAPATNNCRRRRVGAFWASRDNALNVRLSGMSTMMKAGLVAGAGAGGAFLAKETLGGNKSEVRRDEPKRQEPQRQEPPREEPRVVTFAGNYRISATKVSDGGCNFVPSFSGQVELSSGTDSSRVVARMIERLTRSYTGTIQQDGSFSAAGNGGWSTLTYTGQIVGRVNGNTISGTETLNIQNGCGKQVVYSFTGTK